MWSWSSINKDNRELGWPRERENTDIWILVVHQLYKERMGLRRSMTMLTVKHRDFRTNQELRHSVHPAHSSPGTATGVHSYTHLPGVLLHPQKGQSVMWVSNTGILCWRVFQRYLNTHKRWIISSCTEQYCDSAVPMHHSEWLNALLLQSTLWEAVDAANKADRH